MINEEKNKIRKKGKAMGEGLFMVIEEGLSNKQYSITSKRERAMCLPEKGCFGRKEEYGKLGHDVE